MNLSFHFHVRSPGRKKSMFKLCITKITQQNEIWRQHIQNLKYSISGGYPITEKLHWQFSVRRKILKLMYINHLTHH